MFKTILNLIFASLLFTSFPVLAVDKILVAGDSWAVLMCTHNSVGTALKELDAPYLAETDCSKASAMGAEARNWIGRTPDKTIKEKLAADANLKTVILSLGGNDLIRQWNKEMSIEQEKAITQQVLENIQKVVAGYLAVKPDLKVIISGYDFPRFEKNHPFPAYAKLYVNMKEPTPLELNEAMIRFTNAIVTIANNKNIFYIHHLGMSQYYDGSEEDRLPALTTLSPDFISSWEHPEQAGGNKNIMSSAKSLDHRFGFTDPYHLSQSGYHHLVMHVYKNVILPDLRASHSGK